MKGNYKKEKAKAGQHILKIYDAKDNKRNGSFQSCRYYHHPDQRCQHPSK